MRDVKYCRCRVGGCTATAITMNLLVTSSREIHIHKLDASKMREKEPIATAKSEAINQPFKSIKRVFSNAFYGQQRDNEFKICVMFLM